MYTIDLLKGQAVPAKANLKVLALMTAAFAILIFGKKVVLLNQTE